MKKLLILLIALSLLLTGCGVVPPDATEDGTGGTEDRVSSGWVTEAAQTFYIREDGSRHSGWLELDGNKYYLDEHGVLQTGWLELSGKTYYLKENGAVARGKTVIDNKTHYFIASGEEIILANPWNIIPASYEPELKDVDPNDGEYMPVDVSCWDALVKMLADCRKAGHGVVLISAYRRHTTQITLFNNKVNYFLNQGYSEAAARTEAATIVAMPGTSEHELGLAVDLVDSDYTGLDEAQENTDTQKWLMEHCWDYGFILRYPNSKSAETGIIYEPWHYRYVGKELAKELQTTGLCLEEYLGKLY